MALEEEEENRISSLPDCLLIEILSRLDDTKYAIRTGTLSKIWQHLWPQLSNLFFTHFTECNMPQFYSSLERILKTHKTQVNMFKLDAFYNNLTQVSNCIRSVISCNVQEVDFDMTYCVWAYSHLVDGFVLPDFFFTSSSFIRVSLCGFIFERVDVISWENLRTLHIDAFIDEYMIENILSGSPLLETLELACCEGFERIDITTNKSVKNLGFFGYGKHEFKDVIQINAPYILTLAIKGLFLLKDLMLLNVSSLIKAELSYSTNRCFQLVDIDEEQEMHKEMLKGHLLNLAHVKEVKIGKLCLEVHRTFIYLFMNWKQFVIAENHCNSIFLLT